MADAATLAGPPPGFAEYAASLSQNKPPDAPPPGFNEYAASLPPAAPPASPAPPPAVARPSLGDSLGESIARTFVRGGMGLVNAIIGNDKSTQAIADLDAGKATTAPGVTTAPLLAPTQLQAFVKQNTAADGTPLDPNASLPISIRTEISGMTPPEQFSYLKNNGFNPRVAADSQTIIVPWHDANGSRLDVLADPVNPLAHPVAALAGNALPLAKAAALTVGGAALGNPELGALARTGGALLPATVDAVAGRPAREAAVDTALTVAPAALMEGVPALARTVAGGAPDAAAQTLTDAANAAAARQNVQLPLSAVLGSPNVAKAELAFGAKNAVAAPANAALRQSLLDSQGAILDSQGAMGSVPLSSQADIAAAVKPVLSAQDQAASSAVQAQLDSAQQSALNKIQKSGSAATNADVGAAVRNGITARKEDFDEATEKNYNDLYAQAEKNSVTVSPGPEATQTLNQLTNEIPEVAANVAPGLKKSVLTAYQLSLSEPLSLQQAITMRNALRNNLVSGVYVGPLENQKMSMVAQSLNTSLKQAIANAPKPVQDAYALANDSYAQGVGQFNNADVARLAQQPTSAGYVADHEIVPSLLQGGGNTDALNNLKTTLGEGSEEYVALKRQLVQHLLDTSATPGAVADKLGALNPDFSQEILGPGAAKTQANATLAKATEGGAVPDQDLADALKNASPDVARKTRAALAAQDAYRQQYQTGLMRQLRDGTLSPATLGANPDHFVQNFVKSAGAADTAQVLASLPEPQQQAIAHTTLQGIVDEARAPTADGSVSGRLNPAVLQKYLTGPDADKYAAALAPLGPEATGFLQDSATINRQLAARDAMQAAALPDARRTIRDSMLGGALGYGLSHSAGGAELGTLMGLGADLAPAAARVALGNAMRNDAVNEYLKTGVLPTFYTGAAQAAPPALAAAKSAVTAPQPLLAPP